MCDICGCSGHTVKAAWQPQVAREPRDGELKIRLAVHVAPCVQILMSTKKTGFAF